MQGGSGAKQGHDKQASLAQPPSQAQAGVQAQQGAGSKGKSSKQSSKIPQQQKGTSDKQAPDAVSLPSDMFAHLQQYKVGWCR